MKLNEKEKKIKKVNKHSYTIGRNAWMELFRLQFHFYIAQSGSGHKLIWEDENKEYISDFPSEMSKELIQAVFYQRNKYYEQWWKKRWPATTGILAALQYC